MKHWTKPGAELVQHILNVGCECCFQPSGRDSQWLFNTSCICILAHGNIKCKIGVDSAFWGHLIATNWLPKIHYVAKSIWTYLFCILSTLIITGFNKTIFFYKKTAKKIHFVAFLFSTLLIFKQDLRFILWALKGDLNPRTGTVLTNNGVLPTF